MIFDVKAVENIISSSPRKNGCFNLFFQLNDQIGIKLSSNKNQRDTLYKNQQNAAKFDLGPEVFGKIDEVEYEGKKYFGYFTEIVWVLSQVRELNWKNKSLLLKAVCDDLIQLRKDLSEKCDYDFYDNHIGNIGVKNGKLVCIDFDTDYSEDHRFSPNY
jgi:hypothetical protein